MNYTFDIHGLRRAANGSASGTPTGIIVRVSVKFPPSVKFRISEFRAGVFGTARVLSEDISGQLVEFAEGTSLEVFFPDGTVTELRRAKGADEIVVVKLSQERMAVARVNMCIRGLNTRPDAQDQRARIEDAIVYQLELIYRFGTDKVRKFVMDFVYDLVDKKRVGIRKKPMQNLLGTLSRHNKIHYYGLNQLLVA